MSHSRPLVLGFLLVLTSSGRFVSASEPAVPVVPPTSTVEVASEVDRVVLYRGGADVRRSVELTLEPGIHEIVFTGIPDPNAQGLQGLRASTDGGWTVIGVETFSGVSDAARLGFELEAREWEEEHRREQARRTMTEAGLEADLQFIESIGIRTGADATHEGGTEGLDLDVVRQQFEFVRETRGRIQSALQELENDWKVWETRHQRRLETQRQRLETLDVPVAQVRVAVIEEGTHTVEIRYLRRGAAWSPAYAVRSRQEIDVMPVMFEAIVTQFTGEDWSDVEMALSSASPSSPGLPPDIQPIYVERARSNMEPDSVQYDVRVPETPARKAGVASADDAMSAIRTAAMVSGGSAVTYELPGLVSVAAGGATSTLRIASFEAPSTRVLVARPVESEQVYLRGDLVNQSEFVLLAGRAALFMEGEYVGPSRIEEVPPGGGFEVWFGPDPTITISRMVVARDTQRTGLLGGGRQTSIDYRIELRNDGASPATVEVWDRRPVSREEDIEVRIVDASPPVADDAVYRGLAARRGLLKWMVELEPAGSENASRTITWTVRVNRPSDLDLSPIPD